MRIVCDRWSIIQGHSIECLKITESWQDGNLPIIWIFLIMSYLSRKVRFSRNNRHHSNKQNWENIHIFCSMVFPKGQPIWDFWCRNALINKYSFENSYSRGSYRSDKSLNFMHWKIFCSKIHRIWSISKAVHLKIINISKLFSSIRT